MIWKAAWDRWQYSVLMMMMIMVTTAVIKARKSDPQLSGFLSSCVISVTRIPLKNISALPRCSPAPQPDKSGYLEI